MPLLSPRHSAAVVGVLCQRGAAVFSQLRPSVFLQLRPSSFYDCRSISQHNGPQPFLMDTLATVEKLEGVGVPLKEAKAIVEVINDSLQNVTQSFVTKEEIQMSDIIQEANFSKFKFELQISQKHHFSLLQREIKKVGHHIDKTSSELRYEIYKMTAEQCLGLQRLGLRRLGLQLNVADYYCIGCFLSFSAASLAVFCSMK